MPRLITAGGRDKDSYWSHTENRVHIGLKRGRISCDSLGHEMAHAYLGHYSPRPSIERFDQEIAAWDLALSRTNELWRRKGIEHNLNTYIGLFGKSVKPPLRVIVAALFDKHKDKLK